MAYAICRRHRTVSAWGCPVCRDEAFALIVEKSVAEVEQKIKEAFAAKPALHSQDQKGERDA